MMDAIRQTMLILKNRTGNRVLCSGRLPPGLLPQESDALQNVPARIRPRALSAKYVGERGIEDRMKRLVFT